MHSLESRLERRDPAAVAELYDACGRQVYAAILRIVRDPTAAEDLMQETFLRFWVRLARFDPARGRAAAWLLTMARNTALDYLRAARLRTGPALDEVPPVAADSPDPLTAAAVQEALRALDPVRRRALELAYREGLTNAEVAERLHRPLGTVKTWLRSGLRELAAQMA
jgi:RNA polymerase sigma-70 factor (ECF subfamily)